MGSDESKFEYGCSQNEEILELRRTITQLRAELVQLSNDNNKLLSEISEIRNSKTYKLAKKFAAPGRRIQALKSKTSKEYKDRKVYPYMISVVVAVYNTEDYLEEMLESLLKQKKDVLRGFLKDDPDSVYKKDLYEDYCEIILVDDGSVDRSSEICDSYAKKYNFVKAIHKKHEGVSSARNEGILNATGKYITFPDSDDKLSDNVFQECFLFFENNEDKISLVTYPLRFFDAEHVDHWTTYRFYNGTRIIDLKDEWDKPQYFTAASFFKTKDIKGQLEFDTDLINGEDIKFVHELMFTKNEKIGLISNCTYWYRRRSYGDLSVIQKSRKTKDFYMPYLTGLMEPLLNDSEKKYGYIPKYVQSAVMGQLQWRMPDNNREEQAINAIGQDDYQQYLQKLKELILRIDNEIILAQHFLDDSYKKYLCAIKDNNCNLKKIEEIKTTYNY